jgi:hypothetical protein
LNKVSRQRLSMVPRTMLIAILVYYTLLYHSPNFQRISGCFGHPASRPFFLEKSGAWGYISAIAMSEPHPSPDQCGNHSDMISARLSCSEWNMVL